ncbi:MAG: HlyD family secretion protein [Planctomycetota bacterium]|jgi:multidrug resistance efflux pump
MYKLVTAMFLAGFIALGTVAAQDSTPGTPDTSETPAQPAEQGTAVKAPKLKRLSGERTIEWVAESGSAVEAGAVVAKVVIDGADRQLKSAERNVRSTQMQLASMKEGNRASNVSAARELQRAERGLARANEDLEHFNTVGMARRIRQSEIHLESRENSIKDQKEEIAQLDKLYKGNELGQESADIVLNRAKRRLKVSEENFKMSQDNHERLKTVHLPREKEDLEYAVEKAQAGLDSAKFRVDNGNIDLQIKIMATEARLEDANRAVEEVKSDLTNLEIKAPAAGTIEYSLESGANIKNGQKVATIK